VKFKHVLYFEGGVPIPEKIIEALKELGPKHLLCLKTKVVTRASVSTAVGVFSPENDSSLSGVPNVLGVANGDPSMAVVDLVRATLNSNHYSKFNDRDY
jgi:hypothetical protein